jgi:hypothetical protein
MYSLCTGTHFCPMSLIGRLMLIFHLRYTIYYYISYIFLCCKQAGVFWRNKNKGKMGTRGKINV